MTCLAMARGRLFSGSVDSTIKVRDIVQVDISLFMSVVLQVWQ